MNPLNIIQDSLYFFRRNLGSIALLCLPVVILEVLAKQALGSAMSADTSPAYALVIGLFFYPVYTAALILFLDARSRGEDVHTRDVLAMAVRLWPTFAVLSASFLQLFTTIVTFRLFMLISEPAHRA